MFVGVLRNEAHKVSLFVTSAHPMAAFGLNGQLTAWLSNPIGPPTLHDIPTTRQRETEERDTSCGGL